MGFGDRFAAGEVGDGAGDAQDAVVGASREAEGVHRVLQRGVAGRVELAMVADLPRSHAAVQLARARYQTASTESRGPGPPARASTALLVPSAGLERSSNGTGGTSMCRSMRSSSGPQMRPMYFSTAMGAHLHCVLRVAQEAARARVHRGDQDEVGREGGRVGSPADGHAALFERLPERFEAAAIELGQLIEEQDAVVGERDLARLRDRCRRRPCPASEIVWCGLRNGRVLRSDSPGASRPMAE